MVHHRALRATSRTRGENEVGDIGTADGPLERRTAGQEIGVQVDDRYAGGHGVVLAQKTLLDKNSPGCAAGDDVAGFLWLEPRVHRHQYTASGEQPEGRDDPLRRVGRPHSDAVALLDS